MDARQFPTDPSTLGSGLGDPLLDASWFQRERARVDVGEDRRRSLEEDTVGRGHEAEGRRDDLIARAETQCRNRQVEGAGPAVDYHCVLNAGAGSQLLLERRHLRAQAEG